MKLFDLFEAPRDYIAGTQGSKLLTRAKDELDKDVSLDHILDTLSNADPSGRQKYLQWIVNRYLANEFKLEDVTRLRGDLETFERIKRTLEKKDINQYKTLNDLYAVTDVKNDDLVSNKQKKKDDYRSKRDEYLKSNQAELLYNGPEGTLISPKTEEASCFFGQGTKWCTAAKQNNMFDNYTSSGPLYIWLGKDGKKIQFHLESDQWMDETDTRISIDEINKLRQIPIIKKLYDDRIDEDINTLIGFVKDDYRPNGEYTEDEFDEWSNTRYRLRKFVRLHGMNQKILDFLFGLNPRLPYGIFGEEQSAKSNVYEKYLYDLSKIDLSNVDGNISPLISYQTMHKSPSEYIDKAFVNLIKTYGIDSEATSEHESAWKLNYGIELYLSLSGSLITSLKRELLNHPFDATQHFEDISKHDGKPWVELIDEFEHLSSIAKSMDQKELIGRKLIYLYSKSQDLPDIKERVDQFWETSAGKIWKSRAYGKI